MSDTAQRIAIRTIYVQPQYYEDNNGNWYIWYVWEGAEVAIVADCLGNIKDYLEGVMEQ